MMLVLWLVLAAAPAPPPTASLVIERASAAACEVDPGLLAARVAGHLGGRDPFAPDAPREARVRWSRAGARVVADISMIEPDGRRGERRLDETRCPDLIEAVALALAIAIDPLAALAPARPTPMRVARSHEGEARAERRDPDEPQPRAPSAIVERGLVVTGGFTLGLVAGAAPAVAIGPGLRLELGDRWRVALEGGVAFAGPSPLERARVAVTRLEARLEGCRVEGLVACAGLHYTRWRATTDEGLARPIDEARDSLALAATLGVALGSTRLELGLAVPLTPPARLVLDGRAAFTAWPVFGLARLVIAP
ncbi:MAG: hypothetical protein IT385_08465 [Deltaproteobacteria bacterium]|nr:hypothetical protein [Deltaproteobacteria bacterium]